MSKVVVALGVLAVVLGGAALVAQTIKPPKVDKKVVTVSGTKDWTSTGFTVRPGDTITVEASGTVKFSNGENDSAVGPDGYDRASYAANWPYDAAACDDPVAEGGHAALLIDVNGEREAIGSGGEVTGKEGLLFLGINDCTFTGDWKNTGAFTAVVRIQRAPAPAPH